MYLIKKNLPCIEENENSFEKKLYYEYYTLLTSRVIIPLDLFITSPSPQVLSEFSVVALGKNDPYYTGHDSKHEYASN